MWTFRYCTSGISGMWHALRLICTHLKSSESHDSSIISSCCHPKIYIFESENNCGILYWRLVSNTATENMLFYQVPIHGRIFGNYHDLEKRSFELYQNGNTTLVIIMLRSHGKPRRSRSAGPEGSTLSSEHLQMFKKSIQYPRK